MTTRITHQDALNTLPPDATVVDCTGHTWRKHGDRCWKVAGDRRKMYFGAASITLPAEVIPSGQSAPADPRKYSPHLASVLTEPARHLLLDLILAAAASGSVRVPRGPDRHVDPAAMEELQRWRAVKRDRRAFVLQGYDASTSTK